MDRLIDTLSRRRRFLRATIATLARRPEPAALAVVAMFRAELAIVAGLSWASGRVAKGA